MRFLVVMLFWAACVEASAQVVDVRPDRIGAQMDAEDLGGFVVGVGAHAAARLSGEAFEGLGRGWGLTGFLGAKFGSGHALRIEVVRTRFSDDLASGPARSLAATLQTLWRWSTATSALELGPELGAAWLKRDFYEETTVGLVVGALAAATRSVSDRVEVRAEAGGDWFQFKSPTIAGGPADADREALGFRMRFGLAVAYSF